MATKPGRNDPCHCGSGKKYKRCCLDADAAATSAALAAERDRMNAEDDRLEAAGFGDGDEFSDDWFPDDDDDLEMAPPFERGDVLLVNYERGFAQGPEQMLSGENFQVTEWMAPDIPAEILETFEREAVWELHGAWGDPRVAHPVQFDLITIQTTTGEVVIEAQNRGALLAVGGGDEDLASITRVSVALEKLAKQGTGRSWISQAEGDDAAFDDGMHYDPDAGPDPSEWLALSEAERIERVRSWHTTRQIPMPSPQLHAVVHTVIENQIALRIPEVIDALDRLRSQGLTRHDAVHAIGAALSEEIFPVLKGTANYDLKASYLDRVKRLTADDWWRLAEDDEEGEPR
ncbi:MAG TPA: SEC-C metal-binding domain-containing protein [Vicinamibacterales bacterium]